MNKGQPHSWARPLYLSHHGGGKKKVLARERETRRMEKNSFDQSLKPITRRKLLTRGLSLSVCLPPFSLSSLSLCLCSLCIFLSCLLSPPSSSLFTHFHSHSSSSHLCTFLPVRPSVSLSFSSSYTCFNSLVHSLSLDLIYHSSRIRSQKTRENSTFTGKPKNILAAFQQRLVFVLFVFFSWNSL